MRVAVNHTDSEHPNAEKFAFRLGRAQSGVDFITGEERLVEDTIDKLLEAAKAEYPESDGYTHQVERLVEDGDTAKWVPIDEAEALTPVAPGETQEVNLEAPATINVTEGN